MQRGLESDPICLNLEKLLSLRFLLCMPRIIRPAHRSTCVSPLRARAAEPWPPPLLWRHLLPRSSFLLSSSHTNPDTPKQTSHDLTVESSDPRRNIARAGSSWVIWRDSLVPVFPEAWGWWNWGGFLQMPLCWLPKVAVPITTDSVAYSSANLASYSSAGLKSPG